MKKILIFLIGLALIIPTTKIFAENNVDSLLESELQKLEGIRNDKSNEILNLSNLKEKLGSHASYIRHLEERIDLLYTKIKHIKIALDDSNKKLANFEIMKGQANQELEQIRQIVLRILTNNPSLPKDLIKKIDKIVKTKLSLRQEIDKKQRIQLIKRNEIDLLKEGTDKNILSVKDSMQKYQEEFSLYKSQISFFENRIEEMQALEDEIRTIVLAISKTDQKEINLKIKELEVVRQSEEQKEPATQPKDFIWPVEAKEGLSAVFMDKKYKEIFKIDHPAIDIPTPQGTPIKSIADAVVIEIKEAQDDSYQYIILGHLNNTQSVYGHLNEIHIKPGDLIKQGQIIGLSGGIPGTLGAGPISTGAHLHLEIIKNGSHIDPLSILE